MNKKRNLLIMIIALSLILILGSSYAYLTYTKESTNNYVINVGTLEVAFVDSKTEFLNLSNMYPMTDDEGKEATKELVFQVKNTGNVDSYYDVSIEEVSTNPEFKSVIKYIVNKDSAGYNEPKVLGNDKYIEAGGLLKPNGTADYRVKVWLSEEADNTYMNKEFKAKIAVKGNQNNYATDVIKKKLVRYKYSSKEDFNGGLVAVNTDGELYEETDSKQIIREYRYSGSNVNNYVTFNDETWRIVGVFKEGNEEFLKIVNSESVSSEKIPDNFQKNNILYKIKADNTGKAYWNNNSNSTIADWTTAGIQYYLNNELDELNNKGYLSFLTDNAKKMIRKTKYYLGNVKYFYESSPSWNGVNTIDAYNNERESKVCDSSITELSDKNNCNIWYGNQATWEGDVGLLYPSDYGYAANSKWWKTLLVPNQYDVSEAPQNNWIALNFSYSPVMSISPSSRANSFYISLLKNDIMDHNAKKNILFINPVLYLKSNVKIISGDGTQENQYKLSLD